ncbi:Glycoprotein membrane precursor GPI-anchored [Forsythia ovata]|uniref:Glycoprotein membrane GPI-anchored n=1 Tax=Forsythia ovata TaxID=205694 RepID=A0ABD1PXA9_9LAMI
MMRELDVKHDDDHLLQGINSFRQSSNVPPLAKHDNANCLAEEIADQLEDKPCVSNYTASSMPSQLANYPSLLKKCKIDINSTRDGVILPVCVPHRVATLVLTNYTQSQNSRYLNNSKYTGVGMGHEDDWTVLVLATNTPGGTFASKACLLSIITLSHLVSMFLGLFLALVN